MKALLDTKTQLFNWFKSVPLSNSSRPIDEIEFSLENFQSFLFFTKYYGAVVFFHTIWICLVVRHCAPYIFWWQSYLLCGFMTFAGNYIVQFITYSYSPLLEHPADLLIFSIVWLAVNCSTRDFFYRFITLFPNTLLLQLINCVIQVRSFCFAVKLASKKLPDSITGAFLISLINSSMDSFIWMMFIKDPRENYDEKVQFASYSPSSCSLAPSHQATRYFSNISILRNGASALFYLLSQRSLPFLQNFEMPELAIQIYLLGIYLVVSIIDDILFGIQAPDGIDITGITYFSKLFTYYG